MNTNRLLKEKKRESQFKGKEFLKYIGPGILVTVGFIDPGNWASNIAAGSTLGINYFGLLHYQQ